MLLYLRSDAERRLIANIDQLTENVGTVAFEVKLGVESAAVRDSSIYATAKQQIGVDLISLFDHDPGQLAANRWTFATKGQ